MDDKTPAPRKLSENMIAKLVGAACLTAIAVALIAVHQYDYLGGVAFLAFFLFTSF